MPEIAGLTACLRELLVLPESLISVTRRAQWFQLLAELPPLPSRQQDGLVLFAAGDRVGGPPKNVENPELYAVFPYHLCGRGTLDVDTGIQTFQKRLHKHDDGWAQDGIQAALLGLAEEARRSVVRRFSLPSGYSRFPAFWGPNADWIPDQDHGGSAMHAFQLMALQADSGSVAVLPAWPEDWDVEFKLHAPNRTVVECRRQLGRIERLTISPEERLKSLVLPPGCRVLCDDAAIK
jgi:hypothetical protein